MQWETATPVGFPVCVRHNCVQQCYSNVHTSIATLCRRIIAWRRQGTLLLDSYDALMEDGNVSHKEKFLGSIPVCLEASIDAGTYTSRRSAAQGKLVHCGGPILGCSNRAPPHKELTALWLCKLQHKKDLHGPRSPKPP